MNKNILNLGKALNKAEQKTINGGNMPCFEWCALDLSSQSMFPKPQFCNCRTGNNGGSGNSNTGGGNNGPVDPV